MKYLKIALPALGFVLVLYSIVFLSGRGLLLEESIFWFFGTLLIWYFVRTTNALSKRNIKYVEFVGFISGAIGLLYTVIPTQLDKTLISKTAIESSLQSEIIIFKEIKTELVAEYCALYQDEIKKIRLDIRKEENYKSSWSNTISATKPLIER